VNARCFHFDTCLQNAAKRDCLHRHVRPSVRPSVRSSACPHKISLRLLCRDFRKYILEIFTKMYRPVLNYPVPCIEQLDTISKPKNTRKCVKNTVCILYFHTRTCVCWLNLSTKFKSFYLIGQK
jgi:hypothetical protein